MAMNNMKKTFKLGVMTMLVVSLFLSLFVIEDAAALVKVNTSKERIFGANRYETSLEIADAISARDGLFDAIVLASGENYPDALSGSFLAKKKDAPILLVTRSKEDMVLEYVRTRMRSGGTVYILGGTGAIGTSVEDKLDLYGIRYKRLGGANRFETNLLILQEAGIDDEPIMVCSGMNFADSLSASAVGNPVLLVDGTLKASQEAFLASVRPKENYIIGGVGAVSLDVFYAVSKYAPTYRVGGATRFETSVNVAKTFFPDQHDVVVLTDAYNFPDGLCAGPFANRLNSPVILVSNRVEPDAAKEYVESRLVNISYAIGGSSIVADSLVDNIMTYYRENQLSNTGTAQDVLNVMRSWLGYSEVNKKYMEIIDIYNSVKPLPVGYPVKYTDEWCDATVSAAAIKANCADVVGRECGCGRHLEIFRRKGIWIEDGTITPKPGYVIIYNWGQSVQPNDWGASHIGYVESVINGEIIVIEGNYNEAVRRRVIPIGWGYIRGYAAPRYNSGY